MCKSSILKLETKLIEVPLLVIMNVQHTYLEDITGELQNELLKEVSPFLTEADNILLEKLPSKEEVKESLRTAKPKASSGTEGITNILYKVCWDTLGDGLTKVAQVIHEV